MCNFQEKLFKNVQGCVQSLIKWMELNKRAPSLTSILEICT